MTDSKDLKLKGVLEILENDKTIFKENNEILLQNSLEILLMSLTTQTNIGIDILRISGIPGVVDIPITGNELYMVENTIRLKTMIKESDYNGYINKLELVSSHNDKVFSRKQNLNIFKDDSNKLSVVWSIILNLTL